VGDKRCDTCNHHREQGYTGYHNYKPWFVYCKHPEEAHRIVMFPRDDYCEKWEGI
jgi:hypothetical protein